MKKSRKPIIITSCIIVGLFFIAGLLFLFYRLAIDPYRGTKDFTVSRPYTETLTKKEATKDLDYLMDKLRSRHPAWLEDGNERVEQVEARYTEIKDGLTDLTVMEFDKKLGYLLHPLHDGHTYAYYMEEDPLLIDDTSYLKRYGRPTHLNGELVEQVLDRYLAFESYEIEEFEIAAFFDNPVCFKKDLEKVGIDTSEGVTYTYIIDGKPTDIHHDFIPYSEWLDAQEHDDDQPAENHDFVYYSIDEEKNLGIFVLTACIFNKTYKQTVDSFFKEVAEKNITNISIDLRDNGGGNSNVANYFLRYLDVDEYDGWDSDARYGNFLYKNRDVVHKNKKLKPQFSGDVYVLTNRRTFSAAKDFTMLICDNHLGKVVGQASSNLPDTYGDCLFFNLPNSRINLSVSYKHWYRIDKSKTGQPLTPDIECDFRYALEKVYELIK